MIEPSLAQSKHPHGQTHTGKDAKTWGTEMFDCREPELWTVGGSADGKCCAFSTVSDLFLERPEHWWKEVIENGATVN